MKIYFEGNIGSGKSTFIEKFKDYINKKKIDGKVLVEPVKCWENTKDKEGKNILEYYYGIIFNVLSIILLIIGISMHQIIIVNKQEYKSNSNTIKRRFSSYMTE